MAFTATDARQIQQLFSLPVDDLRTDSKLWDKFHELEDFDEENGTTLVTEIQNMLAEISGLDSDIEEASINAGIKRERQEGEYEIEYHPTKDSDSQSTSLMYRKMVLVYRIANDLGIRGKVIS